MSYFVGVGNARYRVDKDESGVEHFFNEADIEVDPVTYEPLDRPVEVEDEKPEEIDEPVTESKVGESFTCDVCGKSFSKKFALAGHARSHKGGI